MKYKAEIFDKFQYMYEETKFSDHQLHCVITLENKLNVDIFKKAIGLLLKTVPILSCVYVHNKGNSYWRTSTNSVCDDVFTIVNNKNDFNIFTNSKTDELIGPQIKICLYRSNKDSISIIMNHMICDAAGFKECIYLLSNLYTNLMENPNFSPDYIVNGDRSIQDLLSQIGLANKIKILLLKNKDSNQKTNNKFPINQVSQNQNVEPFIITHEISPDRFATLLEYCKDNNVTINDVVLTAYYRALSKMMNVEGRRLSIPIMVDMRRYLNEQNNNSITNLTCMTNTSITVKPKESFIVTLKKVNKEMNSKKANYMGMNGVIKLALADKIINDSRSYSLIKNNLINPYICMTNIGIIDSKKLVFKGTPVTNAFMCGSIKYRPHFQLALSSFKNKITFSSNLYGTKQDRNTIEYFFSLLEKELPK